jgi:hypothetical protein
MSLLDSWRASGQSSVGLPPPIGSPVFLLKSLGSFARDRSLRLLHLIQFNSEVLTKRLPKVATEMALHALAYNLTRVMNMRRSPPVCCPPLARGQVIRSGASASPRKELDKFQLGDDSIAQ